MADRRYGRTQKLPEEERASRRGLRRGQELPDFGAIALGANPVQTMRILGLVRAGHSYQHIVEIGHYQGAWSRSDVDRVLRDNRVRIPDPPDPATPHSRRPTSARTVPLTARQMQVTHYLCNAQNDEEMAQALGLSVTTVRSHVAGALRATGCRDRLGLVVAVLSGRLYPVEADDA